MSPEDIEDRIADITADIDDLASDADLSTGEILLRVYLKMAGVSPKAPVEDRQKAIDQFINAARAKAVA